MEFPYTDDERAVRYAANQAHLARMTMARVGDILAGQRVPVRVKSFLMCNTSILSIVAALGQRLHVPAVPHDNAGFDGAN